MMAFPHSQPFGPAYYPQPSDQAPQFHQTYDLNDHPSYWNQYPYDPLPDHLQIQHSPEMPSLPAESDNMTRQATPPNHGGPTLVSEPQSEEDMFAAYINFEEEPKTPAPEIFTPAMRSITPPSPVALEIATPFDVVPRRGRGGDRRAHAYVLWYNHMITNKMIRHHRQTYPGHQILEPACAEGSSPPMVSGPIRTRRKVNRTPYKPAETREVTPSSFKMPITCKLQKVGGAHDEVCSEICSSVSEFRDHVRQTGPHAIVNEKNSKKRYGCTWEDCRGNFSGSGGLLRHIEEVHAGITRAKKTKAPSIKQEDVNSLTSTY